MFLDEVADAFFSLGVWMFTHPVATGTIFTVLIAAGGIAGWQYEMRRGGK